MTLLRLGLYSVLTDVPMGPHTMPAVRFCVLALRILTLPPNTNE